MRALWREAIRGALMSLVVAAVLSPTTADAAAEVGAPAPDFSLRATTGGTISLSQFRGKKHVLIEFYSADFAPV